MDHDPPSGSRLVCHPHRVLGDALPLHGALEHALQHSGDLLHAGWREAVALELCEVAVEHGGTQLAQFHAADVRQDVPVPQRLVGPQGLRLEVRNGVFDEPLLAELGQRYPAGVHDPELPQPPQSTNLGVERLGVALPADRLGAIPTVFVAPANTPYLPAVAASDLLDAHAWPRSTGRSTERKLPGGAGLRAEMPWAGPDGVGETGSAVIQRLNSSSGTRSRARTRKASNSPLSIAR